MRILKVILVVLCLVSFVITITAPIISSYMQGYYKSQFQNGVTDNSKQLLEKKQLWAQIGETKIFLYILIFNIICSSMIFAFMWFKTHFSN